MKKVEVNVDGKPIIIETGLMARQANGSVIIQQGETKVLVTICGSKEPREGLNFLPLSVEYREKAYAAGMIPGGFFKREGRPSEKEILSSRLIDRPLRPLFPKGYRNEVQVFAWVISFDQQFDGDVLGILGSSAAIAISDIPYEGKPYAAIRVGKIGSEYVFNPTVLERDESSMDIIVAGNGDDITMVEGHGAEITEDELIGALEFAKPRLKELSEVQNELIEACGKEKFEWEAEEENTEFIEKVREMAKDGISEVIENAKDKEERSSGFKKVKDTIKLELEEKYEDEIDNIGDIFTEYLKEIIRDRILKDKVRIDGRSPEEIRNIDIDVSVIPRAHGSALFTRGETQSLTATTLGTKLDEQMIDNLEGESWKSFMLHYNFPPFSVGEVRPARGPGRREIGHGHLAETALTSVIPTEDAFPYTVRIVSDILESNGSSSQATICAGSLALMDAGVPIKTHVAGIANGLVKSGDDYVVLTDILGEEDHYGDMDFKIAGTKDGITAFQMDIKINGLSLGIMKDAIEQAREARIFILNKMNETIDKPRTNLSRYAPRIHTLYIPTDKIGELIGPSGKNIRGLQEETGTKISIDDDGKVVVASVNADGIDQAIKHIEGLSAEPELDKTYLGTVKTIMPYGAFVEILPGTDGLLHISEIDKKRIDKVEDVMNVGDKVEVKVIGLDRGKIRLSRKVLLD
ncbi:MAG: polyribonucleotide nucleotidyltransferase [Candidatus Zixiibacteriota bacterium]